MRLHRIEVFGVRRMQRWTWLVVQMHRDGCVCVRAATELKTAGRT